MTEETRRPISQRDTSWAKALTQWLVRTGLTPNQISALSVVFAALAGVAFGFSGVTAGGERIVWLVAGAFGSQLRLLCNMMDGMVAVEGGKGGPDGGIWNEAPDRVADILIFVGAGYGAALAGAIDDPGLGWAAAVAAVMTAYVREVCRSAGAPMDFSGPMAKPHRMAVMTVAALFAISEEFNVLAQGETFALALVLVALGSAFTAARRTWRAVKFLRAKPR